VNTVGWSEVECTIRVNSASGCKSGSVLEILTLGVTIEAFGIAGLVSFGREGGAPSPYALNREACVPPETAIPVDGCIAILQSFWMIQNFAFSAIEKSDPVEKTIEPLKYEGRQRLKVRRVGTIEAFLKLAARSYLCAQAYRLPASSMRPGEIRDLSACDLD